MKHLLITFSLMLAVTSMSWGEETACSIIQKIDQNRVFTTETFKATMVISQRQRQLTKTFFGYGQHEGKKAFMEFTNAEDKGVKYLKLENELWIYFPDADDVMKISGHMLRQGMMGSDLSYEDMLENESLAEEYNSRLLEGKTIDDRECYLIELQARKPDATYDKQVIVVDKTWFLPLEVELYARGGRLLKTMKQTEVQKIGDRWVPRKIIIKDLRKRDSQTVVTFDQISFDSSLPSRVFTLGYLKR